MLAFRYSVSLPFLLPVLARAALTQDGGRIDLAARSPSSYSDFDGDPDTLGARWLEDVSPSATSRLRPRTTKGVYCLANKGKKCPHVADASTYCGATGRCSYRCRHGLTLVTKRIKDPVTHKSKAVSSCRCNGETCTEPYPHNIGHVSCAITTKSHPPACGIKCPSGYHSGSLNGTPSCVVNSRKRS